MFKTVVYVIVDPVANNVKSEQSETKPQKYVLLFALLTNTMTHKTKAACLPVCYQLGEYYNITDLGCSLCVNFCQTCTGSN